VPHFSLSAFAVSPPIIRRQFLSLPRLYFSRYAVGRLLWQQYARSDFLPTLASPTFSGRDHLFDMLQHGKTYPIVRGGALDDVRVSLAFESWAEGETARELLLAAGF